MEFQVFESKYSPQQTFIVKKDIVLVRTPTRTAFCQNEWEIIGPINIL